MSDVYDSKRPWIRDVRDDPDRANLFLSLLNPAGESRPAVFTRVWSILFFARVLTIALALSAGIAGAFMPAIMGLVPALWGIAGLTFVVSIVLSAFNHARRLNDAGKPIVFAWLVFVPLVGAGAVLALLVASNLGQAGPSENSPPSAAIEQPSDSSEGASQPDDQASDASAEMETSDTSARSGEQPRGGQGGRGGPPQSPMQKAVQDSVRPAILSWLVLSLAVTIWSLRWLASRPPKDRSSEF